MPQTFGNMGAHVTYRQSALLAESRRHALPYGDDPDASHGKLSARFKAAFATVQRSARRAAAEQPRSGLAPGYAGSGDAART